MKKLNQSNICKKKFEAYNNKNITVINKNKNDIPYIIFLVFYHFSPKELKGKMSSHDLICISNFDKYWILSSVCSISVENKTSTLHAISDNVSN